MSLEPDEKILRHERIHPGIFAVPVLVAAALVVLSVPVFFALASFARVFAATPGFLSLVPLVPEVLFSLSFLLVTTFAYAFTEERVAMLSTGLRSVRAVQVNN